MFAFCTHVVLVVRQAEISITTRTQRVPRHILYDNTRVNGRLVVYIMHILGTVQSRECLCGMVILFSVLTTYWFVYDWLVHITDTGCSVRTAWMIWLKLKGSWASHQSSSSVHDWFGATYMQHFTLRMMSNFQLRLQNCNVIHYNIRVGDT